MRFMLVLRTYDGVHEDIKEISARSKRRALQDYAEENKIKIHQYHRLPGQEKPESIATVTGYIYARQIKVVPK